MPSDLARVLEERYVVERSHTGSMGRLFIVRDRATGERLAAKTVREDLGGEQVALRFQVEARAWMALGKHPHVVEARFFRELEGRPFLFLEYVEGTDLERLMAAAGPLALTQVVELARSLFAGLAHAHGTRIREGAEGLVHRDLKPANLLLRKDRVLKVSDFGLVKVLGGTRHTAAGQMLGTLAYAAPEQLRDAASVDARADLFSAGAILFELLSGQRCFPGETVAEVLRGILMDVPPRLSTFVSNCSYGFSDLVAALLEKEPERRPASAADVLRELERLVVPAGEAAACAHCGLATRRRVSPCPLCEAGAPRGAEGAPPAEEAGVAFGLRLRSTVSAEGLLEVPSGPFLFGAERAVRTLGAFWIDRVPVTNRQFHLFVEASGYRPEQPRDFLRHWRAGQPPAALLAHPVVWVSHADAEAYAAWAGKQLPTWEQWEKAARGTDGRTYPWGDTFDALRTNTKEGGATGTTSVEQHPQGASPCGCLDMAGNVCQWTSTWREPDLRRTKVVCGASWATALAPQGLRRVRNLFPGARDFQTGFRCLLEARP